MMFMRGIAQKHPSIVYYDEGNIAIKKEQYKVADSLFTLSINSVPHPDAYYNRAVCKGKMGDKEGYCNDLYSASRYGDSEANEKFWKNCGTRSTFYKNEKNENADSLDYLYKEVISTSDVIHSYLYLRYDSDNKFLEGLEILNNDTIYGNEADTDAEFPGGLKGLSDYLKENITYPKAAIANNISGKIYVTFIVNRRGEVDDISVSKGIKSCVECNAEAMRVVQIMPKWTPAKIKDKPVSCRFQLPISFKIKD